MRRFWLFRTNLRQLEYYHKFTDLEEFKQKCHDFYLLQGIWFLENDIFDEVVIWRLYPFGVGHIGDTVFKVKNGFFIQRFVHNFEECFSYPKPDATFFRGGFPEYGKLTKKDPGFFGTSLYCGTGKRVEPQYGGRYKKILVEDNRDIKNGNISFYKTVNPNIFGQLTEDKIYDICWPCNFSQIEYKGQEWFIFMVNRHKHLQKLKILHVGNKPEMGVKLCKEYGVKNIEFRGYVDRIELNKLLNQSEYGLVTSNIRDGSPRIVTEILASRTPLLIRSTTRVLDYYFDDRVYRKWRDLDLTLVDNIPNNLLSMDTICQRNLEQWQK
jgi:hypothetical protein